MLIRLVPFQKWLVQTCSQGRKGQPRRTEKTPVILVLRNDDTAASGQRDPLPPRFDILITAYDGEEPGYYSGPD